MSTPIIKLENVHKSYFLASGEEIPILKGIDLGIGENEFLAIMGESGGGKSTLLNILGCLHPLTSGNYFLEGENINSVQDDFTLAFIRNKKIGFVFQQFNLITKFSALKNVAMPAFYSGDSKKVREEKAAELLDSVGLGHRLFHRPNMLSGGEQQRVAIARSLINDPAIILADEPTGALDTRTGEEIMQIFKDLNRKGKTIVMVTHGHASAKHASRIAWLQDGKVLNQNYKLSNTDAL